MFSTFYFRFLSNKRRCFASSTEINVEQNLHTSGKFSARSNFNCNVYQYSLDGNISAESLPFLPEIFFVKECIEEIARFVAAVK